MLCAATVTVLGTPRQCYRDSTVDAGPVHLCWQHAAELEQHYNRHLGVYSLQAEVSQMRLAWIEKIVDWRLDDHGIDLEGPCVYIAESPTMPGLVKIGHTTRLRQRMLALDARAVIAIPGTRADEDDLHRRFAHLRSHREWFLNTGELRQFIDEAAA